ncbi:hypothetical protein LBW89_14995 [Paenibacillus sp. alder61]|nr:hypothetical protein [Paenibacillus sp. alder61]
MLTEASLPGALFTGASLAEASLSPDGLARHSLTDFKE